MPTTGGRAVTGEADSECALRWVRRRRHSDDEAGKHWSAARFNVVVESNTRAVALRRPLGFRMLATVPEAFAHPGEGLVGPHITHRHL